MGLAYQAVNSVGALEPTQKNPASIGEALDGQLGVAKRISDGAEREFQRAIELNPNYAHAHQEYSLYLSAVGRNADAEAEMKRAVQLDPTSQSIGKDVGDLFYLVRDYEKALEQYRLTLKIDPTDPLAIPLPRTMAWTYEFSGMHEQAIAEFIETSRIQNAGPERLTAFRRGYDTAGTKGYCRAWLRFMLSSVKMILLLLACRNHWKIILWTCLRCAPVQVLMSFVGREDTGSLVRK